MTLLRVHDLQQDLTTDFVKMAKISLSNSTSFHQIKETIYLKGQEMGFCNDEIEVLLEEVVPGKS